MLCYITTPLAPAATAVSVLCALGAEASLVVAIIECVQNFCCSHPRPKRKPISSADQSLKIVVYYTNNCTEYFVW